MAYTGRLRSKGVSILGVKYMKGQGLIVEAYEVEKTCFVMNYLYSRKLHLQQLNGMQSSKQGISERGFQLLIEGIERGTFFVINGILKG